MCVRCLSVCMCVYVCICCSKARCRMFSSSAHVAVRSLGCVADENLSAPSQIFTSPLFRAFSRDIHEHCSILLSIVPSTLPNIPPPPIGHNASHVFPPASRYFFLRVPGPGPKRPVCTTQLPEAGRGRKGAALTRHSRLLGQLSLSVLLF